MTRKKIRIKKTKKMKRYRKKKPQKNKKGKPRKKRKRNHVIGGNPAKKKKKPRCPLPSLRAWHVSSRTGRACATGHELAPPTSPPMRIYEAAVSPLPTTSPPLAEPPLSLVFGLPHAKLVVGSFRLLWELTIIRIYWLVAAFENIEKLGFPAFGF